MLATNVVAQMLYLNVASLVPLFFISDHPIFNSLTVGLLFATYQVAFITIAPLIGMKLESYGRRRAMFTSIWIFTLSTSLYASAGFIQSDNWFYALTVVARMLQGIGDAFIRITIPSIIAHEFPDKIERY